jgi:GNAT superfamily N-acetyltransferase
MLVKEILASETYDLRHSVLRPGFPRNTVHYEQDRWEGAFHLGVFLDENLITVGSFYKTPKLDPQILHLIEEDLKEKGLREHELIYQLRGMATAPEFRNYGAGSLLLNAGKKILQSKGANLIWCNARELAFSFYRRLGFVEIGEFFNTYSVPHKVMYKWLK